MTHVEDRGSATRDRIIEAALETLQEEGFAETTARAIARRGDFNQALIFYHFGSVANLLLEAFTRRSTDQVAKYRAAVADVSTLTDLVEIGRRLYAEDLQSGAVTAVSQLMAAASTPEQGGELLDRFEAWIRLLDEAFQRTLRSYPFGSLVRTRELAYAVSAMFLGIELMARLDPKRSEAHAVFDMLATVAALLENFASTPFSRKRKRKRPSRST